MKKARIPFWAMAACLAALPLAVGYIGDSRAEDGKAAASGGATNVAPAAPAQPPAPVSTNTVAERPPDNAILSAPARKVVEPILPASIPPNSPVAEMIKLVQAGVDEGVMLSYVTNSTNTYNLGADEIVFLKDVGVPESVVKAMIEQDAALRAGKVVVAAAPPANPPVPPAQEPAPAQVAPQFDNSQAPPAQAPASQGQFDTALSPYGSWIDIDGYGRVWQPTVAVANPGWRPYCDGGRWVYTDYGWYWMSDYTWGWAPFHYGRWFQHYNYGWCWAPDYVWGPAWVTWRYCDAYCGWAPLPPYACWQPGFGFTYYGSGISFGFGWGLGYYNYCFVPVNNMCAYKVSKYQVPTTVVNNFYNSTVVVNKTVGDNNVVINPGIPAERVAQVTRKEVPKMGLRDVNSPLRLGGRGEAIAADGKAVSVYRPTRPMGNGDSSVVERISRGEVAKTGTAVPAGSFANRSTEPSRGQAATLDRTSFSRPQAVSGAAVERGGSAPATQTAAEPAARRSVVTGTAPAERGTWSRPDRAGTTRPTGNPTAVESQVPRTAGTAAPRAVTAPEARTTVQSTPATPTQAQRVAPQVARTESRGSWSGRAETPSRAPASVPSTPAPRVESRPGAPAATAPAPAASRPSTFRPTERSSSPFRGSETRYTPPAAAPAPASAPVRTYSAPAPQPAPSYQAPMRSAPAPSAPARAPSYSAPAPSAPRAPSYSAPAIGSPAPSMAPSSGSGGPFGGGGRSGGLSGRGNR